MEAQAIERKLIWNFASWGQRREGKMFLWGVFFISENVAIVNSNHQKNKKIPFWKKLKASADRKTKSPGLNSSTNTQLLDQRSKDSSPYLFQIDERSHNRDELVKGQGRGFAAGFRSFLHCRVWFSLRTLRMRYRSPGLQGLWKRSSCF